MLLNNHHGSRADGSCPRRKQPHKMTSLNLVKAIQVKLPPFKPLSYFKPHLTISTPHPISNLRFIYHPLMKAPENFSNTLANSSANSSAKSSSHSLSSQYSSPKTFPFTQRDFHFLEYKEKAIKKHQEFWTENNLKFMREKEEFISRTKEEFISRTLMERSAGHKVTSHELSRFYKDYLDRNHAIMMKYNADLWREKLQSLPYEIAYEIEVFSRYLAV